MIGKARIRAKTTVWETVLDYTTIAQPLHLDQIQKDITALSEEDKYPEKIEMWEHQWDYLIKGIDNTGSYLYGKPNENVGYKSIWGIPVMVLK